MINLKNVKKFCKDDFSLIENYDKAIADNTQTWVCHHRRETIYSAKELIEIGEYYNRPACELIFLTKTEHRRLHTIGKNNPMYGHSVKEFMSDEKYAEWKENVSKGHIGLHWTLKKPRKPLNDESRNKISVKCAIRNYGRHWYNNGMQNVFTYECPEGFVQGRK